MCFLQMYNVLFTGIGVYIDSDLDSQLDVEEQPKEYWEQPSTWPTKSQPSSVSATGVC